MSKKIAVSISGVSGYTGLELIRLLHAHPDVELKHISSKGAHVGKISDLWPHLKGVCELALSDLPLEKIAKESDCIFFALPHLETQKLVQRIMGMTKIIDLSADFRLKNSSIFKKIYGAEHVFKEGIKKFIYGVPEFYSQKSITAENIANPGCFAIATELALWPIKAWIESVKVLGITGSSGSGKSLSIATHHPTRSHNVKSYKIGNHPHEAEIIQALHLSSHQFMLVPTSGPFVRGIHITAFVNLNKKMKKENISEHFKRAYKNKPFIRIKSEVQLAEVIGSNYCDISVNVCGDTVIVQAVIDNLVKGASGNAIQNFNLMFGLDEATGLKTISPLFP